MGSRTVRGWLALTCTLAALLVAVPVVAEPSAADRATARDLMKQGDEMFAAHDFPGALKAYQSAHAIMQVPTTGLAVAKAQKERGQLIEARDTLLQVARLPKDAKEPAALAKARDEAAVLAQRLADRIPSVVVTIDNPTAGVEVQIDGEAMSSVVLGAPRKVNPGAHVISALSGGRVIASSPLSSKEGATDRVLLKVGPSLSVSPSVPVEGGGALHIISSVESGDLFLDGRAVGATPLSLPVSPGKHTIAIEYPGGTHDSRSVEVSKDATVEVTFSPSGLETVARPRRGLHYAVTGGPSTAVYLGGAGALYGATAGVLLNIGGTPMFDFRTGAVVTFLGTANVDPFGEQLSVGIPVMLKVNYTSWLSFAAGLFGGFSTDFHTAGYSLGPEWSPLILSAGDKRQYELGFTQGIRFGTLVTDFQQTVAFTYLWLD